MREVETKKFVYEALDLGAWNLCLGRCVGPPAGSARERRMRGSAAARDHHGDWWATGASCQGARFFMLQFRYSNFAVGFDSSAV